MRHLILLISLLFLSACTENRKDDTDLHGKWQGVSWLVDGEASNRDAGQVSFEFQPKGTYTAAFGSQTEAGSYRVAGDKLYTNAEGQAEKMVQVTLSGPDTLLMNMNRAGTPEVLVLVKK